MHSVLKVLSALALAAVPLVASAQQSCSQESWQISGAPVHVEVCAERSAGTSATLSLRVTGPSGEYTSHKSIRFVPSVGPARALETVPLAQVGLHGTLHLGLAYDGTRPSIESALLTPGAIQLK